MLYTVVVIYLVTCLPALVFAGWITVSDVKRMLNQSYNPAQDPYGYCWTWNILSSPAMIVLIILVTPIINLIAICSAMWGVAHQFYDSKKGA